MTVRRLFAGWADPDLKRQWFCEPGAFYESDFRAGGRETSRGPSPGGVDIVYEGRYSEIVEGERIVYTYDISTVEGLVSVSLASVEFAATAAGSRLKLVEQIAMLDGREQTGWRMSGIGTQLDRLARSV